MSLLDLAHKAPVDWFLVFEEGNGTYWWSWFLKEHYSHVYAVRFDGANWIKVEPRIGYVDVDIISGEEVDDVVLSNCGDILHTVVWREINRIRVPWGFGAINCVETMKSLLGIRAPFVWTPWQLSKYLRVTDGYETKGPRSNTNTEETPGGSA